MLSFTLPIDASLNAQHEKKNQQLSPLVPNTLADPLLVWTDAKLAILQSVFSILLCLSTRLFAESNKIFMCHRDLGEC